MGSAKQSVLQKVDARTKLVGHNRLELLLFRLDAKQRYGINVFKVREVINRPEIKKVPNSHPAVAGLCHVRESTFTIIDLQHAIGMSAVSDSENCSVIVTEYNRNVQGFLVPHIEHIVNKQWDEIHAPPKMIGDTHYLTGVTQIDDEIIEILDVEKVIYEISGDPIENLDVDEEDSTEFKALAKRCHILIVDDSSVARNQIKRTLGSLGVECTLCNDGKAALEQLTQWADADAEEFKRLALVVSDVEMPEMDGYTLTSEIRKHEKLKSLTILLHTSLSGVFDSSLLETVEADGFLAKFDSAELLEVVKKNISDFSTILDERGL